MNYPILIGDADGMELAQRAGNPLRRVAVYRGHRSPRQAVQSHLGSLTADKLQEIIKPLL